MTTIVPVISSLLEPFVAKLLQDEASSANVLDTTRRLRLVIEDQSRHLPSQYAFSDLMNRLTENGFELLNCDIRYKLAGIAILDCLLDVNDENNPDRRTTIASRMRKLLESDRLPLETHAAVFRAAALCIGHFARIASTGEIENLQQSFLPPALNLLKDMRVDSHRFAGALLLTQLALNSPSMIFAKRKNLFGAVWEAVTDRNATVRGAAAEALEAALQVVSQREIMSDHLKTALKQIESGFKTNSSEKIIGSLLVLEIVVSGGVVTNNELQSMIRDIGLQPHDIIWKVLRRKDSKDPELKRKVIDIIPKLASCFSTAFSQTNENTAPNTILRYTVNYLLLVIKAKKDRQIAYLSLGKLFLPSAAMRTSADQLSEIFNIIVEGFSEPFCVQAMQCLGMVVSSCIASRKLITVEIIDAMFRGGLTSDLIDTLKILLRHVPGIRSHVQSKLCQLVSSILNTYEVIVDESVIALQGGNLGTGGSQRASNAASAAARYSSVPRAIASGVATRVGAVWSSPAAKGGGSVAATTGAVTTTVTQAAPSHAGRTLWGFGFLHDNSAAATMAAPQLPSVNPDALILLALQVLASQEFFPKQLRDRERDRNPSKDGAGDDNQSFFLLDALNSAVARYLDDYNPQIRGAAAVTCLAVLDTVVLTVDTTCPEYPNLFRIMDRLLLLGVGDDAVEIRRKIFSSFSPSLDHAVVHCGNLHCLLEALNDESIEVRSAAMSVMSRAAHYDALHLMPWIRMMLRRLMRQLQFSIDPALKYESVEMLQALVRGTNALIVPYVGQILGPLISMLNDTSSAVVGSALSTIGELAAASPESVRAHFDDLLPRIIDALNDQSSVNQREIAVVAMGKLVSSLTIITDEPYARKYPRLFHGLVAAIQHTDDSSMELRLQAIRTAGLLGTVDSVVYQEYLSQVEGEYDAFASPSDHVEDELEEAVVVELPDGEKKMNKMEKYYFNTIVRAVMNIIKDDSLSAHHQTAANIVLRIVKIVGPQVKPWLSLIIDGFVSRLEHTGHDDNLLCTLLEHVSTLILVAGRIVRKNQITLVKLVLSFMDTHTQLCLDIVESMCLVFHHQDFNSVLQGVMPLLMSVIRDAPRLNTSIDDGHSSSHANIAQTMGNQGSYKASGAKVATDGYYRPNNGSEKSTKKSPLEKTRMILQTMINISNSLGEYRRQLIPVIVALVGDDEIDSVTRISALCFLTNIADDPELHQLAPRIVQPVLRILPSNNDFALQSTSISVLAFLLCRLRTNFLPYVITVHRKLAQVTPREGGGKIASLEEYEWLVARLLKERSLPSEPACYAEIRVRTDERIRSKLNTVRIALQDAPVSVQTLETAWALAGRNQAADIADWMRRLSMELIRQSPSHIIRSCATLARTYRPLAESLFNIAFISVWDELFDEESQDVVEDIPLINSIEMSLRSPQIPTQTMTSLLNLAEFMEMQDKPLPLDVQLLAKGAETANMFAKCVHYREIEFISPNVQPSGECIEALISVNNQLGLPERAAGVLHHVIQHYSHIPIEALWLEKLCRWDDARQSYKQQIQKWLESFPNDSPPKHPPWMMSELGQLRCLHALGELEQLQSSAEKLKDNVKAADHVEEYNSWMSEVQKLGANAAWMLRDWGALEDFLDGDIIVESQDVDLNNNASFYRTILAIHKQDYPQAMSFITETRTQICGAVSALLSESYTRAYRAMVSMQILAELEEVVEYKQTLAKAALDLETIRESTSTSDLITFAGSPSMTNLMNGERSAGPRSPQSVGRIDASAAKATLLRKWKGRFKSAPKEVDVYRQILAVRTLVTEPSEDLDNWLELVTLCRKEGMFSLCENLLRQLGAPISPYIEGLGSTSRDSTSSSKVNNHVMFATHKFWWHSGSKQRALNSLTDFLETIELPVSPATGALPQNVSPVPVPSALASSNSGNSAINVADLRTFRVRCLLKRAEWMRELNSPLEEVLKTVTEAKELAPDHHSVWHAWAVTNYDQLKKVDIQEVPEEPTLTSRATFSSGDVVTPPRQAIPAHDHRRSFTPTEGLHPRAMANFLRVPGIGGPTPARGRLSRALSSGTLTLANLLSAQQADHVTPYAIEAIKGFVHSIVLGQGQPLANILQDTLRLLTLWFSYGTKEGVYQILTNELDQVSPETWLSVIPQLIARMHVRAPQIAVLLRKLLMKVASTHPQALVCPISVALNTHDKQQKAVATELLNEMRKRRSQLVEEATMVSRELMRVAITPHELWHDGLEKAANLYMDTRDKHAMLEALTEMHETMNESVANDNKLQVGFTEDLGKVGHTTLRDVSFRHSYGRQLAEALDWLEMFKKSGRTTDLHQAWEIYHIVFKKVRAQIKTFKNVELHHVSPALTAATDLRLAVPGTYKPSGPVISISSFSRSVEVIQSKQRPRRMFMMGSDGNKYQFLLKGHEDLRQDERVMQLFGLINVCLDNDRTTGNKALGIVRYSVLPLSNNSGVIGWVENCDTLNQLVKQYRDLKDKRLGIEVKLLQTKSMNYDKLPLLGKVEAFRQVLDETTGQDLEKMLWLKSKTADVWVQRRANFTKSCAVMSMAGYILGLGDRHPSNLMLHRMTGRVVHIDFGDCFEITKQRLKYPEIIPFRLTRMMTMAMGQSGIAGTYRVTCERVMRVLRDNRDSVMAMLEAFVYDPLISWRLLARRQNENIDTVPLSRAAAVGAEVNGGEISPVDKLREQIAKSLGGVMKTLQMDDEHDAPAVGGASIGAGGGRALLVGDRERDDDDNEDRGGRTLPAANIAASILDSKARWPKTNQDIAGPTDADEPLQENLNARALEVITRIQAKLTGRDFCKYDEDPDLTVEQQVDRLVKEATSVENLCQLFQGWCPLW